MPSPSDKAGSMRKAVMAAMAVEGWEHGPVRTRQALEAALPHLLEAERAETGRLEAGFYQENERAKAAEARCAELEADHAKTIRTLGQRDVQLYMAEQRVEELEAELLTLERIAIGAGVCRCTWDLVERGDDLVG